MGILFLIVYLAFCILVAYAGRQARLGFFGILILSVLVTPLIAAILLVLFSPKRQAKAKQ